MCDDIVSMYIFLNCEGVFIIYPLYMSINLILVPSEPRSLNKITEQSNKIFVGGCVSFSVRSVAFFFKTERRMNSGTGIYWLYECVKS